MDLYYCWMKNYYYYHHQNTSEKNRKNLEDKETYTLTSLSQSLLTDKKYK